MSNAKVVMGQAANTLTAPLNVEDVFSTYLWAGNDATQTINNGVDLTEGGLTWIKNRTLSNKPHFILDTERGGGKYLSSDTIYEERDTTGYANSFSFNSNGFSFTSASDYTNISGSDYASWTFRKAPKFFDVVTYTGDGTSSQTIPHNLGGEVGFVVVKKTSASGSWFGLHRNSGLIILNETGAAYSDAVTDGYFGDGTQVIRPTSTHFTIGSAGGLNDSGATLVAYLFAHNDGDGGFNGGDIIKCGSYTGTGAAGNFVELGWEPQFVIRKSATGEADWFLQDSMRSMSYSDYSWVFPNSSLAESEGEINLMVAH